jgi:lipid II:glycine glycyltransferase (peptidoglycan interpeptide bridge formation enzyme)
MDFIDITENHKEAYNNSVNHPLQSFEWGEFRKKTGIRVIRRGVISGKKITNAYTMTLHKVPRLPYMIGYLPKGDLPTSEMLEDVKNQALIIKCIYVQLEPNIELDKVSSFKFQVSSFMKHSFHPLFTKYSFILDLKPAEENLLKNMHSKTRYNIRVAQKHGVKIIEDISQKGFDTFLKLYEETTTRQRFYSHTPNYHKTMWEVFKDSRSGMGYHLLHARYKNKTLASWVLFSFKDALYYPYGASSREHRETMASNLIMWESILLGKKLKLESFDMWGALGPEPDTSDPWHGFHKFKQGYGAKLVEFVGSYDFIISPKMYEAVKVADKLRWGLLKLKKRF